ncbi:hypothetical protein SCALM49S_08320 [Streptomyces californicus]
MAIFVGKSTIRSESSRRSSESLKCRTSCSPLAVGDLARTGSPRMSCTCAATTSWIMGWAAGHSDGLAYVKSADDELLQDPGATTPVPLPLLQDVVDSAKECPGDCIHVQRVKDSVEVYGPDAD